ncbi:hypothetical protein DM860_009395 [Cuscuta australis]|uniref:HTH myb-type domain-containing protein n=1 Tax=Cuscuta australis TaxID=267555 RepID=A0A328DEE2_9ASTE|nr:hypothetical protein DM860_009395 [Cuscuta australis]
MGRSPCCDKNELKKGPWTPEEDLKLIHYVQAHGPGSWRLQRCGKSCRLRWTNYLRPDIKRGEFSFEEEETIIQLHSTLGNKWSAIAANLPGRTDNEIKNYWNTHVKKRLLKSGIDPVTHTPRRLDLFDLSSLLHQQLGLQAAAALMNRPEAVMTAATAAAQNNEYAPNIHHGHHGILMLLQKVLLQESLLNDRQMLFQRLLQENHALIMNGTHHHASTCAVPDNMQPRHMSAAAATGSSVHTDDYGYNFGADEPHEPHLLRGNPWSPAAFGSSGMPLSSPAADSAGGGSAEEEEEEKERDCCGDLRKLFEIPSGLDLEDLL